MDRGFNNKFNNNFNNNWEKPPSAYAATCCWGCRARKDPGDDFMPCSNEGAHILDPTFHPVSKPFQCRSAVDALRLDTHNGIGSAQKGERVLQAVQTGLSE